MDRLFQRKKFLNRRKDVKNNMLTEKEAKEKTLENINKGATKELTMLQEEIIEAISEG